MTRQNVKTYVDKDSLKIVGKDTPFKGTDERFKELQIHWFRRDIYCELATTDLVIGRY